MKAFLRAAFSENGNPSSSRIISFYLSLSSMALIWFCVRHMMYQPVEKLQVWLGGLPMVIAALASFTVAPYGIAKVTGIWNKNENGGAPVSDPPSNGTTGGKGLQAIS